MMPKAGKIMMYTAGVTVEPEKVLERHRVTVEFRIENPDVHGALSDQKQQRDSEHWRCQDLDNAG